MDSILHRFYSVGLLPQEEYLNIPQGSINHTFLNHKQHFHKLLETHAPELLESFDVLMDDLILAYKEDTEELFCQGFGLAVKLITAGMAC